MNDELPNLEEEDWLRALRQGAAARAAAVKTLAREVEAGLRPLFDEQPRQAAAVHGLLEEFERAGSPAQGLGEYCRQQAAARKVIEESAFGWVRPEDLGVAAVRAWEQAARALKPAARTEFGKRWSAAQTPLRPSPGVVSEAAFAGAPMTGRLFGGDFDSTATEALRKLQAAFGEFLALPKRCAWQKEYWLPKPKVDPPAAAGPGLFARLWAWLRRLFGLRVEPPYEGPRFVQQGVTLPVLPRPVPMQYTVWNGHQKRRAEAAELDADVAMWTREFDQCEEALVRSRERRRKADEPIVRAVSAEAVTKTVDQTGVLGARIAAWREKARPHLAKS
ncbi:MAG TPA: hypothetical protein VGO11_21420 [Chthoniobacteraceae bacterium]|jgi:hypothetical protein|nr:hypothetical protein [Chthoniobacteraceae bacterium]